MSEENQVGINQRACPFCDGDNNCESENAKAEGRPENPCWCRNYTFSEEVLARVPEAAKDKACICEGCISVEQ